MQLMGYGARPSTQQLARDSHAGGDDSANSVHQCLSRCPGLGRVPIWYATPRRCTTGARSVHRWRGVSSMGRSSSVQSNLWSWTVPCIAGEGAVHDLHADQTDLARVPRGNALGETRVFKKPRNGTQGWHPVVLVLVRRSLRRTRARSSKFRGVGVEQQAGIACVGGRRWLRSAAFRW